MANNNTLQLFQRVANEIPAYKQFLATHNINPADIQTAEDFAKVPTTSKKNYLVPNELKNLVWKKDLESLMLFCSTSGSTGKPYYFPRNEELSRQYSELIEKYLKASSYGNGSTLVVIGFGMGVWIGGVITLRAFEIAASRANLPVSILPAGYNKAEIIKAFKDLSPNFEQTVFVGYPPFVKEVVDDAIAEGVDLKKLHMRLLFAAEAFTETFRNYVSERAGIDNPVVDTLNIYGTADIGAMAYETPLSILTRRLIIEDPYLFKDVFKQFEKTPTLAQYNPEFIEFEEVDGEIVLTGDGALPLIRYAVGDHGGVISYDNMAQHLKSYDIDLEQKIKEAGIIDSVQKHPFVFVYERADLAASLQGVVVYPEYIKEGLLKPLVNEYFTERFTMSTKNDLHHNQFLQINIELKAGQEPSDKLEKLVHESIVESLLSKKSEFVEISRTKSIDELVQVKLWPSGHPRYFAPGTKQKWVEKS